ncbi:MAG: hypothetical protein A2X49_14600 [Lentisphaerae bacterium GWF2_52_8]|nr:MAG: hypothetical protein A2X49_14600 [Lentisphaerae bacterium GWF2_52_8]
MLGPDKKTIFLSLLFLPGLIGLVAQEPLQGKPKKIPVCMIIDDGAPFNAKPHEIPSSFYRDFAEWAKKNGVKGKLSIIPCLKGIALIDGSLGEYPGHSKEERLEWIEMIKTSYMPYWTITPEIITHGTPWDIKEKKLLTGLPNENVWLAAQPLELQSEYIAEAMRMLKNVGIEAGGLTMCWNYSGSDKVLGEATLNAAEKVLGLKFVMIFDDTGERPGIAYKRADGALAVDINPNASDDYIFGLTKDLSDQEIASFADKYISADGSKGKFVEQIKKGICLIFVTHMPSLYGNGTESGFKVMKTVIDRLTRHYGERLEWMTGKEICEHFTKQ